MRIAAAISRIGLVRFASRALLHGYAQRRIKSTVFPSSQGHSSNYRDREIENEGRRRG
jgi:hypothetical protein